MARPKSRNASANCWVDDDRRKTTELELPVAPDWWSEPPSGSMEDGIRLSLAVLASFAERPDLFESPERQPAREEFRLEENGSAVTR